MLAISPGPDNLFVLTLSTVHGRKAGLNVTLGLCTGLMVHTLAVTFGGRHFLKTSDLAFMALKYCGAAYLLPCLVGVRPRMLAALTKMPLRPGSYTGEAS